MSVFPYDLPNKRWWVVFCEAKIHRHWWYKLVPSYKPPFQHAYAICEVSDNMQLYIDPQINGIVTSLIVGRPADHIRYVIKTGGKVLFVERPDWREEMDDVELRYRRGWTMTCASVIAYQLGLDTRAVTPKGLYDYLLREHAARELTRDDVRRRRRPQQAA